MQKCCKRDFFDVQVVAFKGPVVRVAGCTLDTPDDLQYAEQRLRLIFQGGFNRRGSLELPEKRFDAKHHDGVGDRRDVRAQMLAGKGLDVGQDANGHQWVLQYDACDVSTADRVDAFVALFKPSGCLPEDGHLLAAEKRHPVINVF